MGPRKLQRLGERPSPKTPLPWTPDVYPGDTECISLVLGARLGEHPLPQNPLTGDTGCISRGHGMYILSPGGAPLPQNPLTGGHRMYILSPGERPLQHTRPKT